ncbi:hypothetical protein LRR81_17715 [Metabacillus sp. GX 13764]|uniref:hypothetical protein n=1 Tax=Metabacillus kandeliae TaxID=2900151 RepID=UPI001E64A2DC|nr:hypothetical protein [Metabacillus kandeliae]MCD7036082.1 hypothetical protein [Metabacillus kandeliae]
MRKMENAMYILVLLLTAAIAYINISLKGFNTTAILAVIAFFAVLIMFILIKIYRKKKKN